MDPKQAEATLLKFAAVFMPELKSLIPQIIAALDTAEKVEAIVQAYKAKVAQS